MLLGCDATDETCLSPALRQNGELKHLDGFPVLRGQVRPLSDALLYLSNHGVLPTPVACTPGSSRSKKIGILINRQPAVHDTVRS